MADMSQPRLPPEDVHAGQPTHTRRWGYPKPDGYSLSYWQQQVRCDPLLNHRSSRDLPKKVDCVVIGSGITGCMTASQLKKLQPTASIHILEAREFCSGATGRNAGHCKPDRWRGFVEYEKRFGREQALQILQNEQQTFLKMVAYIRKYNVDCDLWVGDTFDVPMSADVARIAHENFAQFEAAGGNVDHIEVTTDPAEAARKTRLRGAQACYAWPAATLQPRKLTGHIMRSALGRDVGLHTFTVVQRVTGARGRGRPMDDVIYPRPHICQKVTPPRSFSGSRCLQNSYGVLLPDDGGLFSINPRCTSDGLVMFGGDHPGQMRLNEWLERHPESCVDDSMADVPEVRDAVRSFAEAELVDWDDGVQMGPGHGDDYNWSGIIALTPDGVPFVGEIPGKPGQWACVGHNGHGMARTFSLAPGLARLIAGCPWEITGIPEAFQLTGERLEKLRRQEGKVTGSHCSDDS
ncbi:FAD dependent oxidoreductase [Teratosphaeria destructans]|uniref:FAD dependent oxidoreductase n=1 Tax=Teratosphaeria destructans TaxID=418781 RepID=A0A9W7W4J3_9PEZI|nr:FAD dependent oxidoreductase [Teratosphaeria destructans]